MCVAKIWEAELNVFFLSAAIAAALVTMIHCYLGGRKVAQPMLQLDDVPDRVKYINYGCWHFASITLVLQSLGFLWAAFDSDAYELAVFGVALSALTVLWSVTLNIWKKQSFLSIPHWAMFSVIVLLAVAGF